MVLTVISEEEALKKILDQVKARPSREVPLASALGHFSAEDVAARQALPEFDNSAMDGYAVVAAASPRGARLRVSGEQPAGVRRDLRIVPGEAIRIFTGAPLPAGADAVVMQEEAAVEGDEIVLRTTVEPGEFVRRRGGDIAQGQRILTRGERIRPSTLALLAAQGMSRLRVGGEVRAAVISTGDELVAPGGELQAGQIYDSNSCLLRALLETAGAQVASVAHCADDAQETEEAVRAASTFEVMIIAGGVSVGARDFVKGAITAAGGKLDLWRVSVKPGKPFLFGQAGPCAIFGLPGNPVSAFVTFLLFVRPALLRMMGAHAEALRLPERPARLETALENLGDRPHYIRGILGSNAIFRPFGRQESHALFGLSQSNALLRLKAGETMGAGTHISVLTWD